MTSRWIFLILATSVVLGGMWSLAFPSRLRTLAEDFDYLYLNQALLSLRHEEHLGYKHDGVAFGRLGGSFDYSWLDEETLHIAHRLGSLKSADENSMRALSESQSAGMRFAEVDILLDSDGVLRCAHDNERLAQADSTCTIKTLARSAIRTNTRIVLDVKSDFATTYYEIDRSLAGVDVSRVFIPQLYRFDQIRFLSPHRYTALIFSAHRSNLSSGLILRLADEFGIRAITLDIDRIRALSDEALTGRNLRILTHGVSSVEQIEELRGRGVAGFYLSKDLYSRVK